mgnify:CR=1 FL=1
MPDGMPDRRSFTVRAIGRELNEAVKVRQLLGETDDPQLILDTIEGETNLAEACVAVLEECNEDEILIAGLDAHIKQMQTRKGRMEKSVETRRNIILMAMEKADLGTIKSPLGTLSVRPTPKTAVITDEALIPAKFWRPQDPKLDKGELASRLRSGEIIPGATLSNGGVTLSVRKL